MLLITAGTILGSNNPGQVSWKTGGGVVRMSQSQWA